MFTEPVYRHRRLQSGTDAYDNPVYARTKTQLPDGLFAPSGMTMGANSGEPVEPGREPVVSTPAVYWRRQWPDVQPSDWIEVRGHVYEVIGDPSDWRGKLTGGLVVALKLAEEGVA